MQEFHWLFSLTIPMCHVIPMLNLLSSRIWCYIWELTLPPSHLWRLCLELVSTKFDCTNTKGSKTQQLQHLQYVQYGDLALSKCFNTRTVPGLETWLWACKPMLYAQALNVIAVETTVYQSIELSFGFSIPLHWSYQRLTRLSSRQTVQIETDGKVFQFWLLKFAFKMHGETTCCARLVHPIHWGIISTEPAHLAHPRVQVRPAMPEFYGPAQCLKGTVSNLKPSKTRP